MMLEAKQCTVCREIKVIDDFYTYHRHRGDKGYKRSCCKKCHSAQMRDVYNKKEYIPLPRDPKQGQGFFGVVRNIVYFLGFGSFKKCQEIIKRDEIEREDITLSKDIYDIVEINLNGRTTEK